MLQTQLREHCKVVLTLYGLQVPKQLCARERAAERFVTNNARVHDPVAALVAEERVRPWTADEKRIFMDRFLAHPKVRLQSTWHSA